MKKAITALAAAALLFGVTAASAQTSSSSEGQGATKQHSKSMQHRSTKSSSGVTGRTEGSNPNPTWNKNPDPEVPGNTER